MDARRKIAEAAEAFNVEMAEANDRFNRLAYAQEFLLGCVAATEAYTRGNGPKPTMELGSPPTPATEQPQAIESISEPEPPELPEELPQILRNRPLAVQPQAEEEAWPWAAEVERKLGAR